MKHPGLKPWVKGQSGNPKGAAVIPMELRDCTSNEVRLKLWKIFKMTPEEIIKFGQDPTTSAGEAAAASILLKAIKDSDAQRLEWFFLRLIGKPREEKPADPGDDGTGSGQLPTVEEAKEILNRDYATLPAPPVKPEEL